MFFTLGILIIGTLGLSAVFTPWVVAAIEILLAGNPWPFSRVFNRVAMFAALIMLFVLRRRFSLGKIRQIVQSANYKIATLAVLFGFILTCISVFITLCCLVYFTGDLVWADQQLSEQKLRVLRFVFAALLVAFIEEIFFRGILLQELKKRAHIYVAIVVTSFIYASVHFIVPIKEWNYSGPFLFEGFYYLFAVLGGMWQVKVIFPWIGLFLVGIILGLVMERTRSIYYCAGLHAGWVLGVRLTRVVTDPAGKSPLASVVGHFEQFHLIALAPAWISVVIVGVVALVLWQMCYPQKINI